MSVVQTSNSPASSPQCVIEHIARAFSNMPALRHLGWGFLVAWGTISTFTDALAAPGQIQQFGTYWIWNLAATTASLILGGLRWHRLGRISGHTKTMALASLAIVASTLSTLAASTYGLDSRPLQAALGILAGLGMGTGCLCWGCYYSGLDAQDIERTVVFSALPMALCYGLTLLGGRTFTAAVLVALPLCSLGCYALCHPAQEPPAEKPLQPQRPYHYGGFARTALGVLATALAESVLWSITGSGTTGLGATAFSLAFFLGVALAMALVVLCITFARRLNLTILYRTLVPLLALALLLISCRGTGAAFCANLCTFAAQMCLDILTLIYFCELSQRGAIPAPLAIGLGRSFLEGGLCLGSLVGQAASALMRTQAIELAPVLLGLGFLVTTASMVAMSDPIAPPAQDGPDQTNAGDETVELVQQLHQSRCDAIAERYGLSEREREVLGYLAKGRSTPYIRNELCISRSTANRHVEHIYAKMGIHSRQELINIVENPEPAT